MTDRRFVNNTVPKLQEATHNPALDYEHFPVLTLEEAVESISHLIPGVVAYASSAKKNCSRDSALLTWDESAALYLYTMPVPFYSSLNTVLRVESKQLLRPWLASLKLLVTALKKLPPIAAIVWRGVDYDATENFVDHNVYTWWSLTSCSMNIKSVQDFLGTSGTLFTIKTTHGKDVSMFSAVPDEAEVVLMPGTRVRAKSNSVRFTEHLFLTHLQEVYPQG